MDVAQARTLAELEQNRPDAVCAILHDSGYGELADDWQAASSAFETAAEGCHAVASSAAEDPIVDAGVLRAYARLCLSWWPIARLREEARACIEHPG
ncbi:hypothetical protein [Pseudorhodoferax sp.]|uniref:hypothetical protein n=1 Tax=Pseudorhodoferax sp. TaxID=1993553 RepID=UPI0039E2E51B